MARNAPSQSEKEQSAAGDQLSEARGRESLEQGCFIGVVEVKRRPVQRRLVGDFLDRNVLELFLRQQLGQCIHQHLPAPQDTRVNRFFGLGRVGHCPC